jgi:hypothetical protein
VAELDGRYPAGSIATLEAADLAIDQAEAGEQRLTPWYAMVEQACHQRFFVNSCLHDLKVQRRAFKTVLQRIDVEAKAFERRQHIEQLDKNLEERRARQHDQPQ